MEGGDLKFHIYNMGGEPGFPEERCRLAPAGASTGFRERVAVNIEAHNIPVFRIRIRTDPHKER